MTDWYTLARQDGPATVLAFDAEVFDYIVLQFRMVRSIGAVLLHEHVHGPHALATYWYPDNLPLWTAPLGGEIIVPDGDYVELQCTAQLASAAIIYSR